MVEEEVKRLERDVKSLYGRIDLCMEKVDKVQDSTEALNDDLKEVLHLLKGNPLNEKDNGIVGTVIESKAKIEKLEKFKDKVIYVLIGASLTAGYALSDIINKFLKH